MNKPQRELPRIPSGRFAGKLAKQAGGRAVREYLRVATPAEREALAGCGLMDLPAASPGLFDESPRQGTKP